MNLKEQITADVDSIFIPGLTIDIIHHYSSTQELLTVFFDDPYETALSKDEIESALPEIQVKTSVAGNIDHDSSFTINSKTYYVAENKGNKAGITIIVLSEDIPT
jgi:hypothetical protein